MKEETVKRETINFDKKTMRELWNGVYWEDSSIEIMGETYTHIDKINTSEYSDGESYDYIVQRKSDGKYFKFDVWYSGSDNGYIFSNGHNLLMEVFPKTTTKIIYE